MVSLFKKRVRVSAYNGTKDAYGQMNKPQYIKDAIVSVSPLDTELTLDPKYKECSFIGITGDKTLTDKCVLQDGDKQFKVEYSIPQGRFNVLYLREL